MASEVLLELKTLVDREIPPYPPLKDIIRIVNAFSNAVCVGESAVRVEAIQSGAYDTILRIWTLYCDTGELNVVDYSPQAQKIRDITLQALYSITIGFPDIIDAKGFAMIKQAIDTTMPVDTQILGMKTMRNICINSEDNRDILSEFMGVIPLLITILRKDSPSPDFVRQWCSCVKALLLADDKRVAYNRSPERKRILFEAGGLSILANYLPKFLNAPPTLNAIIIVLSSMACREDFCIRMVGGSGVMLTALSHILENMHSHTMLTQNTLSLLRYLCMSPVVREKVCTYELMESVLKVVHLHVKSSETMEVGLSCCAFMTLRCPCHVGQFLIKGGVQELMTAMSNHMTNIPVLKGGLFTLRNVAVHGHREGVQAILEADVEAILERIQTAHPELKNNYVKPLMRDLGLSVSPSMLPETTSAERISLVVNLPDLEHRPEQRELPERARLGCRQE